MKSYTTDTLSNGIGIIFEALHGEQNQGTTKINSAHPREENQVNLYDTKMQTYVQTLAHKHIHNRTHRVREPTQNRKKTTNKKQTNRTF